MRREGCQHEMVWTYWILPSSHNTLPKGRIFNNVDAPATAGILTKVPSKPTNHSKFTGKCGRPRCMGCHMHPACKSKDKTKGNNKIKSFDTLGHQMVTWRIGNDQRGLSQLGNSASGLLDHLVDYRSDDYDGDEDSTVRGLGVILGSDNDGEDEGPGPTNPDAYVKNGDDDEKLEIYGVGTVLDHVEEGDWCLVGKR
ncbi:hypothetical protein MLD38_022707 [Melastoma candidum]|uniref:Uncharacterized protein n=1 Tax=Melastoma candidum TaxID=119954 RepID=A0ACB9QNJ7_9MYRT|nr:hypothetical protein MLD38_022707 [Melastoma candidum]